MKKKNVLNCLLTISMNEIDFELAQKICHKSIIHEDPDIKNLAITSVGHIARVYKKLVNNKILDHVLEAYLKKDPLFYNQAEEALSDIKIFLNKDLL